MAQGASAQAPASSSPFLDSVRRGTEKAFSKLHPTQQSVLDPPVQQGIEATEKAPSFGQMAKNYAGNMLEKKTGTNPFGNQSMALGDIAQRYAGNAIMRKSKGNPFGEAFGASLYKSGSPRPPTAPSAQPYGPPVSLPAANMFPLA